MLHATASSIILSSRRNGTGVIQAGTHDFHGINHLHGGYVRCPSIGN